MIFLKNIGTVKVKIYDQFKDEFRTFKAKLFAKMVNGFKQLTIFPKSSTSNAQHGFKCTSVALKTNPPARICQVL